MLCCPLTPSSAVVKKEYSYSSTSHLRPVRSPSACTRGYRVFPRCKKRPGGLCRLLTPSSAVVKKEYWYSSTLPYGLYRASVHAQGGTGSFPVVNSGQGVYAVLSHLLVPWSRKVRAIPLQLLRLVQRLSASTSGTGSFHLVNSGRGGLCLPSRLLVPFSIKIRAVHLHHLRLVQRLSACTRGYRFFPGGK